jgi:hypothetical protein
VTDLRSLGDVDLPTFLDEADLELSDLLGEGRRSWTEARRDAGLPTLSAGPHDSGLLKRVRALAHVDDPKRKSLYSALLADDPPPLANLDTAGQRAAAMLFFSLCPDGGGFSSIADGLSSLRGEQAARSELRSVVDLGFDGARHVHVELSPRYSDVPLQVHARYRREEILASLGHATLDRKPFAFREGVVYLPELNIDAFFINLRKSEADFSPTTMYRDYPISPSLFHWESQAQTSVASSTGQRYVSGQSTVWLFARETKQDVYGKGAPYLFLGPATYVSHEGEKPISIIWKLKHSMPADFFSAARVAAG